MLEKYKTRDSNWELLRIIAMLAIVSGHFVTQTKALDYVKGIDSIFAIIFGSGLRIGVALFLFLGTWFMVDMSFSSKRILKLYFEYAIYSIGITLIMINVADIPIKEIINGLFPGIKGGLWFAETYLYLLLIAPFLKKLLNIDRKILKILLLLWSFMLFVKTTLVFESKDNFMDGYMFFIYTFLVMGYYKKYLINKIKIKPWKFLFLGLLVYFILISLMGYSLYNKNETLLKFVKLYLFDYKTVPNILISFPIFYFFQNLNIGKIKYINFIASSAFAVYIIHQTTAFYPYMWSEIFKSDIGINSEHFIIYMCTVVILIYICASVIDYFRIRFLEPMYLNSRLFKFLENKLNKIYNNL